MNDEELVCDYDPREVSQNFVIKNAKKLPNKNKILKFLSSGKAFAYTTERAVDILRNEEISDFDLLYSNGKWYWSKSIEYNFKKYDIPLKEEFVNSIK